MNGASAVTNGAHLTNGDIAQGSNNTLDAKLGKSQHIQQNGSAPTQAQQQQYANGVPQHTGPETKNGIIANGMDELPLEVLQLVDQSAYLPIATLVRRSAQSCWNGLLSLVDQLEPIAVPEQEAQSRAPVGNQSKANLDKKDRLLNFASDQKADFIKLLVLLQWSKNVGDVGKAINLNYWLMTRRTAYWNATGQMAQLKRDAIGFQIPNPDLSTAGEVLSLGRVKSMPDAGYTIRPKLSSKKMIRTLKSLNRLLSTRLILHEKLPASLRDYRIHDGRATFTIPQEFELDLSLLDDSPETQFRVVDFRFLFTPAPSIPDALHAEVEFIANGNIDRDGLEGCFDFFHDLTLSYKLSEFHKQAVDLARNQWSGHLHVEMLRRTLVVQYWIARSAAKSWIEIGVQSGRSRVSGADVLEKPSLHLRWLREGKPDEAFSVEFDLQGISFERVLRQIIAQHTNQLLETMYESLVQTPLFAAGNLELEQTSSTVSPDDCCLLIQITPSREVHAKIDPVRGSVIVSPASEKSERLQAELNRMKNPRDDFAALITNYRCAVAQSDLVNSLGMTSWQNLHAFRPTQTEIRALFSGSAVRINFFRQSFWSQEYSLAITHGAEGDRWWLFQQITSDGPERPAVSQLIRSQAVHMQEELSPAYFESLADYTSGMIVLQRNAEYLNKIKQRYDLPRFPEFERQFKLPQLSFDLTSGQHGPSAASFHHVTDKDLSLSATVRISYAGVDADTQQAVTVAIVKTGASPQVLQYLSKSNPDPAIQILPDVQQITIRLKSSVGQSAMAEILQRIRHLGDIIACVERIQKLSGLTIESLSFFTLRVLYRQGPPADLKLVFHFPTSSEPGKLHFLPEGANPHACLTMQLNRTFKDQNKSFVEKLTSLVSSLAATYPVVSFFNDLQMKQLPASLAAPEKSDPTIIESGHLRVHVIVRQPTIFGLQYFSSAAQVPRDVPGPQTHPHLLARFEVIPHVYNGKSVWLVRAALEEFHSYLRPSYTSQALRTRIKEEIFSERNEHQGWLPLDGAAACLADRPQTLLKALHTLIRDWVNEAGNEVPEPTAQPEVAIPPVAPNPKVNSNTKAVPKQAPQNQTTKQQQPGQRPNGINNQQRPNAPARAISNSMKNKEIITLD